MSRTRESSRRISYYPEGDRLWYYDPQSDTYGYLFLSSEEREQWQRALVPLASSSRDEDATGQQGGLGQVSLPLWVIVIGSLLILLLFSGGSMALLRLKQEPGTASRLAAQVQQPDVGGASRTPQAGDRHPFDVRLFGQAPRMTVQRLDAVLCQAKSPACGTGETLYRLGVQYGIDPAVALAFFHHESDYGTAGAAVRNHSFGNINCTHWQGYPCYDRYQWYPTWQQSELAWYQLIASYCQQGACTIPQIIVIYAPPADQNDDTAYIAAVESDVKQWNR